MAELFDSYSTPVLCTIVQYLIKFCSQPEAAIDVIYGVAEELVGTDVPVKFDDLGQTVLEIFEPPSL